MKIGRDVFDGSGFAVLRGLQPQEFTQEERVLLFAGITSYVADSEFRSFRQSGLCKGFIETH